MLIAGWFLLPGIMNAYPGTNVNPLRDMRTDYNRVRMTRIFGTAYAAAELISGLKLKETLSYDYSIQKDARYLNALSGAGPKSGSDAQSSKGFFEYGKLISSTSLNYIRTFAEAFNTFYVKEYAGVDPLNGSTLYVKNPPDAEGRYDRTLTADPDEAQAIAYKAADPKIAGDLTNLFTYQWFDLGFTFTYSLGGHSFDKTGTYSETDGASEGNRNLPVYALDRWQKPGDRTDVPRFVLGRSDKVSGGSSRFVHSTDHLRLKNLTFGVILPHAWTDKVWLDKVRLYFSGNNLLSWAKWKQYDPEVPVSGEVFCETPPMRTFSFGAEINF